MQLFHRQSARLLEHGVRRGHCLSRNIFALALVTLGAALHAQAAVQPPEKLLPQDTLFLATAPDFSNLRKVLESSPPGLLWSDPAMRPFREKFLAKWKEQFVQPLERELHLNLDDYSSLLQGQLTFAVIQNGVAQRNEPSFGLLLLADTGEHTMQLKTNLAAFRKKWVESDKPFRTEKIRNVEFAVLSISSNDVPRTLRRFFPVNPPVQELGSENEAPEPRHEWRIGQLDSLLIIGNSPRVLEKVLARIQGGGVPALADLALYDADHQAFFREAPFYAWVNARAFVDLALRQANAKTDSETPDPLGVRSEKLITATGFAGLKTVAFAFQSSNEGSLWQLNVNVPETGRQGLFRMLAGEPKDATPPSFVPADALKFQRWRINGQKAWAAFERMLADLSPQMASYLNFILDAANTMAKEKDPGFDVKKNLIANLGDDVIRYEKAPRGISPAQMRSPPSLLLISSPSPDHLLAALKNILGFLNQQGDSATEREFLGHKIFSVPMPTVPLPMGGAKPAPPRNLSYAAGGGYVGIATDASLLEEFLRSSDSDARSLRDTAGLKEAAQKVKGPTTILFGYKNQSENARLTLELLKKDPAGVTNALPALSVFATLGLPNPLARIPDWLDFSKLPAFERIADYFHFTVYAGSSSVQGLTLKVFAPRPPQMRRRGSSAE